MSSLNPPDSSVDLRTYGWDGGWKEVLDPLLGEGILPARVVFVGPRRYGLITHDGPVDALIRGKFQLNSDSEGLPGIGDWVTYRVDREAATILAVAPRRTALIRKVAGNKIEAQVLAANIDRVFIVLGLDGDYSLRRLERFLTLTSESGAEPVIVLNKADCAADPAAKALEVDAIAPNVPIVTVSCKTGVGLEALRHFAKPRETVVFLGSSGVGKSTLINELHGSSVLPTRKVRERDHRGQHTTTDRRLILLAGGALLIDNPGIREVQLWQSRGSLAETFDDIEKLVVQCRFRNCGHLSEPGCAVKSAIDTGELSASRFRNYQSLLAEAEGVEKKKVEAERRQGKKKLAKRIRAVIKAKKNRR